MLETNPDTMVTDDLTLPVTSCCYPAVPIYAGTIQREITVYLRLVHGVRMPIRDECNATATNCTEHRIHPN